MVNDNTKNEIYIGKFHYVRSLFGLFLEDEETEFTITFFLLCGVQVLKFALAIGSNCRFMW